MTSIHDTAFGLAALALLWVQGVPPASVAGVFVVDGDGGPGVDFVNLQAAVDAVPAGSTLVVRDTNLPAVSNDYAQASFEKPLAVVGMQGVRVGFIEVRNLPASETVVLARLRSAFSFRDCAGRVVGEDLWGRGMSIRDCADVVLSKIDLSAGVAVQDSVVDVSDGSIQGESEFDSPQDGLWVVGGDLTLALLDVVGGYGQSTQPLLPTDGGSGIVVFDGRVDVRGRKQEEISQGGSALGSPGLAVDVVNGPPATRVVVTGVTTKGPVSPSVVESSVTAPSLRSRPRPDGRVLFELWANGFAEGVLLVGSSPELFPGATGVTPIALSGRGYGSVILDLPKTPVGEPLFVQALVPSASVFQLSNVVPVVTLPDRTMFLQPCDPGSPAPVAPGETKVFSAADSTIGGAPPVAFEWDLGDGTLASGASPTHAYAAAGQYPVTLTTTGADGSQYVCGFLQIVNEPPVCVIETSDLPALAGTLVQFRGSDSFDPDGGGVSYSWDFGDGFTASTGVTSHGFSNPGEYTVTLTVTDDLGFSTACTVLVEVVANLPPTCSFTPSAPNGNVIDFDASGSSDPGGGIVTYRWAFGDGSPLVIGPLSSVSHAYAVPGTYTVTLTVVDNGGLSSSCTEVVMPGANEPPTCQLSVNPPNGNLVTFDGSGSSDPQGPIASYEWDFGDGTGPVTTSSSVVDHTYASSGTYAVSLTVTDSGGLTSACSGSATAGANDPPTCSFTANQVVGTIFTFDAGLSSDPQGALASYRWDFDDGTSIVTTASPVVSHAFPQPGTFTVELTVTDGDGAATSCSQTISAP